MVSVPIMANGCFRRDDGVGYCGVDAGMLTDSDAWCIALSLMMITNN